MERTDRYDNMVAAVSGVAAAVCYSVLFLAMGVPVVETVTRLLS